MRPSRLLRAVSTLALGAALTWPGAAPAQVTWTIDFDDPGALYASYYSDIASFTTQAGNLWLSALPPIGAVGPVDILVRVGFGAGVNRSSGRSLISLFLGLLLNRVFDPAGARLASRDDSDYAAAL